MDYYKNITAYKQKTDTGPKFFLFVDPLPSQLITPDHNCVVSVDWNYEGTAPDHNLILLFSFFEKTILPILSSGDHIGTHSITGNGKRELCYYTNNYDLFMDEFNSCLTGIPSLPISINYDSDPEWKYYNGLLSMAKEFEVLKKSA